MRIQFTFLTIAALLFAGSVFGQTTTSSIDKICATTDNNKELVEAISDGKDSAKKEEWTTYHLKDEKTNTLYRVRHEIHTREYLTTTFYYSDKQLIKATVAIEKVKVCPPLHTYFATYYFKDNKLLKAVQENTKFSTADDILKQGLSYQDKYYSKTP